MRLRSFTGVPREQVLTGVHGKAQSTRQNLARKRLTPDTPRA